MPPARLADDRGLDRSRLAAALLRHALHQITVAGCSTPTRTPATSCCWPTAGWRRRTWPRSALDGMRAALQNLLLAVGRGDPAGLRDALLELVSRPDEIDEEQLERALGQFMALHLAAGAVPGAEMFTDLFRLITRFRLGVPPEVAAVFRALATLDGHAHPAGAVPDGFTEPVPRPDDPMDHLGRGNRVRGRGRGPRGLRAGPDRDRAGENPPGRSQGAAAGRRDGILCRRLGPQPHSQLPVLRGTVRRGGRLDLGRGPVGVRRPGKTAGQLGGTIRRDGGGRRSR